MSTFRHALTLALAYLGSAPGQSATLVLGTALALFLPAFTWLAADRVEDALLARATSTPVVVGAKGEAFDLTIAALYFRGTVRDRVPYALHNELAALGYGRSVPLHTGHTAQGVPVVGTSLGYLAARGLTVVRGRRPALLGELVAGAAVAREFGLGPGDTLRSDQTNLYNLAGAYPLLLEVVGVLAPTGTADDDALFADVKTTWALDGHLHGHEAVTEADAVAVTRSEDGSVESMEASAAIFLFQELDERTRGSFHAHGELASLPLTAAVVFPDSARHHDQLLGDLALRDDVRAIVPEDIVRTLLGIVLQARDVAVASFVLVAASTVAFLGLVFVLTWRLRADELRLLERIGAARGTLVALIGVEVALVASAAVLTAALATLLALAALDAAIPG